MKGNNSFNKQHTESKGNHATFKIISNVHIIRVGGKSARVPGRHHHRIRLVKLLIEKHILIRC